MELPLDEPSEGEALLRVLAVGLCGSDAHWFKEGSIGDANLGDGLVLGHEFAAVIESARAPASGSPSTLPSRASNVSSAPPGAPTYVFA